MYFPVLLHSACCVHTLHLLSQLLQFHVALSFRSYSGLSKWGKQKYIIKGEQMTLTLVFGTKWNWASPVGVQVEL